MLKNFYKRELLNLKIVLPEDEIGLTISDAK